MKYFEKSNKYNWVDDNNVFVGYDSGQCCCEQADWFISDIEEINTQGSSITEDLESYSFDTSYFEDVNSPDINDSGGMVRFRMINPDGKELFLHLYNSHNGYYSHGFEATINGQKWQENSL